MFCFHDTYYTVYCISLFKRRCAKFFNEIMHLNVMNVFILETLYKM
jgi:hypothetical protein